ncbi:hypothetical protein FOA52_015246 [Chlamydomonas sp. UWO 241]|nr:hypothetical protein FOA52_015246 [Chlamydomonas sp. UWO 241]
MRALLLVAVGLAAISACSAQVLAAARLMRNGPPPPPPLAPLGDLSRDLFTSGDFMDLSTLGGPAVGISKVLLQALQGELNGYFGGLPGPSLPIGPFTAAIANAWTSLLVKFQYSPGIQGFLDYFVPGGDVLQDKLLKAVCTIYPWSAMLPPPVKILKDSYCAKAIPADIFSKILQGIPLPGSLPPLPLPGKPGGIGTPGGLGGPLPGPLKK